mmetsp:Transcript_10122/g.25979  ORF Transcript_10122/g.25979 Transcript_10122/m.25979 type:complete len:206 (-) Transcript_10122:48-665(-)
MPLSSLVAYQGLLRNRARLLKLPREAHFVEVIRAKLVAHAVDLLQRRPIVKVPRLAPVLRGGRPLGLAVLDDALRHDGAHALDVGLEVLGRGRLHVDHALVGGQARRTNAEEAHGQHERGQALRDEAEGLLGLIEVGLLLRMVPQLSLLRRLHDMLRCQRLRGHPSGGSGPKADRGDAQKGRGNGDRGKPATPLSAQRHPLGNNK